MSIHIVIFVYTANFISLFIVIISTIFTIRSDYMYSPQDLAQVIKEILQSKNIKTKDMLEACGLGINTLSNLNHNKAISFDSLAKIADYLDVSVDYLLGRDDYAANSITNTGTNNGTQANIINNDCSIDTFNNPAVLKAYKGLTEREKLSVQMFILDTAAASEKSNAKVEVVEKTE